MKQPVKMSTRVYRSAHGAEPRGCGSWAFVMGREDYNFVDEVGADGRRLVWFAPGSLLFSKAKRLALVEAASRGLSLVAVAP